MHSTLPMFASWCPSHSFLGAPDSCHSHDLLCLQAGEQKRALLALHTLITSPVAGPLLGVMGGKCVQPGTTSAARPAMTQLLARQQAASSFGAKMLELVLQTLREARQQPVGSDDPTGPHQQRGQARDQLAAAALQVAHALASTWLLGVSMHMDSSDNTASRYVVFSLCHDLLLGVVHSNCSLISCTQASR